MVKSWEEEDDECLVRDDPVMPASLMAEARAKLVQRSQMCTVQVIDEMTKYCHKCKGMLRLSLQFSLLIDADYMLQLS
jgi:hypothetical protein